MSKYKHLLGCLAFAILIGCADTGGSNCVGLYSVFIGVGETATYTDENGETHTVTADETGNVRVPCDRTGTVQVVGTVQ